MEKLLLNKEYFEKALNISPDELMDRFVRGDQSRSTEEVVLDYQLQRHYRKTRWNNGNNS